MPGGDRTGPLGQGAMTGRGMGTCGANARSGFGIAGFGGGRGRRRFQAAAPQQQPNTIQDSATELEALKRQHEALAQRIRTLENQG